MSIQVGDVLPTDILLYHMAESGPISVSTQSLFQLTG
jgi:hypothetical protein